MMANDQDTLRMQEHAACRTNQKQPQHHTEKHWIFPPSQRKLRTPDVIQFRKRVNTVNIDGVNVYMRVYTREVMSCIQLALILYTAQF